MQTSPPATAQRRILPPAYLLLAIVGLVVLHLLAPGRHVIAFPWSLAGLVPLVTGVVLDVVADSNLKRHGTTVKPFQRSSSLVTTGAYRLCRHPMYLGFTLILVGLAMLLGTVTPFVVAPLFVWCIETAFIRPEEDMLEARFGDAWRTYKTHVRRWI